MDVRGGLMVVATAGRHMIAYDVTGQPREHARKESPLKFQSRCVAAFPDAAGFAVGSIEGRVGIHYVRKVPNRDSFAFKCHRQGNDVYSVNAIAFHFGYGTFATAGADGVVNFWDKDNKQRLKGFPPIGRSITSCGFNSRGNLFAYASSYDWSRGSGYYGGPSQPQQQQQGQYRAQNEILIHYTPEDEIRPKGKKSGLGRK